MGIKINYQNVGDKEAAFKKVKSIITPEYIAKFQVKVDLTYDEINYIIKGSGTGFTLTLAFKESYCEVDLELSLILRALKSKILSKIEDQLNKNL